MNDLNSPSDPIIVKGGQETADMESTVEIIRQHVKAINTALSIVTGLPEKSVAAGNYSDLDDSGIEAANYSRELAMNIVLNGEIWINPLVHLAYLPAIYQAIYINNLQYLEGKPQIFPDYQKDPRVAARYLYNLPVNHYLYQADVATQKLLDEINAETEDIRSDYAHLFARKSAELLLDIESVLFEMLHRENGSKVVFAGARKLDREIALKYMSPLFGTNLIDNSVFDNINKIAAAAFPLNGLTAQPLRGMIEEVAKKYAWGQTYEAREIDIERIRAKINIERITLIHRIKRILEVKSQFREFCDILYLRRGADPKKLLPETEVAKILKNFAFVLEAL